MQLVKVVNTETAQTILTVAEEADSDADIEQKIADDFGFPIESTEVHSRVSANLVIHKLSLSIGDSFVDG